MVDLFLEGGWGMVPVTAFGLVLVVTAARYAWRGGDDRLRFAVAMAALLVVTMAHATFTNVATVLWFVEDPARTPDAALVRTLTTGLKESTRPGVLGGALLTLAMALVALGVRRAAPARRAAIATGRG